MYVCTNKQRPAASFAAQALDVKAGGDNQPVQRVTSTPLGSSDPALRWPAILGIVLGSLVLLTLCGATFARRRTRRLYGVRAPPNPKWRS